MFLVERTKTLKHNLIAKQFLQEWQKSQFSESNLDHEQQNKNTADATNKISKKIRVACDDNNQKDEVSQNQQLKLKQKQDLLERNRYYYSIFTQLESIRNILLFIKYTLYLNIIKF